MWLQGVGFDGVGWRLYGAEFVDFPAAEGWSQIQGVRGSCGGAPAYVLAVVFVNGVLKDFFVILLLYQDLSVRTL